MAEQEDGTVHWSKRPYISADFGGSKSLTNAGDAKLVALEVNDDYLSFAVENKASNIRIRYSFRRVAKSNYVPKRLFKDDLKIFGYFQTEKSAVANYEISRREDVEKTYSSQGSIPLAVKWHFTLPKQALSGSAHPCAKQLKTGTMLLKPQEVL